MVFRYDGRLPMAGVRVHDVFHMLWIEPELNRRPRDRCQFRRVHRDARGHRPGRDSIGE